MDALFLFCGQDLQMKIYHYYTLIEKIDKDHVNEIKQSMKDDYKKIINLMCMI